MVRQLCTVLGVTMLVSSVAASAAPLSLERRGADLAAKLSHACPQAPYGDASAYQACSTALRDLPLLFSDALAWGGDQPDRQIKKKMLTHFNGQVFKMLYLSLFTFTGRWSLDQEPRSHTPIIRVEAYFRNALPAGDYPYPFWHSADKWHAYETANELRFYLDSEGRIFLVTRDAAGSEEHRGTFAHVTPPAFTDWQWHDADGSLEPKATLLSGRYSGRNPLLPQLDSAYRDFALKMRDESCLECHTPSNKAEAERLVLLQTPLHAAAEIDEVIKAITAKEMPQDDIGLRKDIPPARRAAILNAAVEFRDRLRQADSWETSHPRPNPQERQD